MAKTPQKPSLFSFQTSTPSTSPRRREPGQLTSGFSQLGRNLGIARGFAFGGKPLFSANAATLTPTTPSLNGQQGNQPLRVPTLQGPTAPAQNPPPSSNLAFSTTPGASQTRGTRVATPTIQPNAPLQGPPAPAPTAGATVEPTTPTGLTLEESLAAQSANQARSGTGTVPETPQVPPQTAAAIQNAEQAVQDAMKISPDELSTQADLDRLIESTKKAFLNIEDQPIPLQFITGQLASVERRALGLAEPLERRLARLQAKRTAALDASEFALERADEAAERARAGEGFTLGRDQVRFDAEGNVIARGLGTASSEGIGTGAVSAEAQAWADLIADGRAKISEVPSNIRSEVANAVAASPQGQTPQQNRAFDQSDVALTNINRAIGLMDDVPFGAVGRTFGQILPGSDARDLARAVDTVKALIGFDQLQKMREASPTGGALGQVSEREIDFLQAVAGSLDIGQSADTLRENLNSIKDSFETLRLVNSPDGTVFNGEELGLEPGVEYVKQGDEVIPKSSFNQVGGDTNQALNRPQRNNNPGNVKRGGIADKLATGTDDQGHLVFPDAQTGFRALGQDLSAKIQGKSSRVPKDPTIAQIGKVYAEDPNWAKSVARILGVSPSAKASSVDFQRLVQAVSRQEGFYA